VSLKGARHGRPIPHLRSASEEPSATERETVADFLPQSLLLGGEHYIPIVFVPNRKARTEGNSGLRMAAADPACDVMICSLTKRNREA